MSGPIYSFDFLKICSSFPKISSTVTEKQLNKITDSLEQELLKAKAIDENGRAIDVKKFDKMRPIKNVS